MFRPPDYPECCGPRRQGAGADTRLPALWLDLRTFQFTDHTYLHFLCPVLPLGISAGG